ncbi:ATP-binding protein [Patescibacteria group bacterium]|nr:ATP-binding protein [Patescibacteria group bacterium]
MANTPTPSSIDDHTKEHIANALWLESYDESKIPPAYLKTINSDKNSNRAIGQRMSDYLDWLIARPQSHNPNYKKRYNMLKKYCDSLTPHQAYIFTSKFLGLDATLGYEGMHRDAKLEFMRDHQVKPDVQVGWHFFVGSAWGENGKEYGIECMFFQYALFPPELVKQFGLSDQENQIIELQFGVSESGKKHYQADPIVIAGTSGLIDWTAEPFSYSLGKNKISSGSKDELWPLSVQAMGIEKNPNDPIKLAIDLTFNSGKAILPQGDEGVAPYVDGWGTLYYSIPNLVLKAGSTLTIGDETIKLKKGTFWFDHQWGFMSGNAHSLVIRASANTAKPSPVGWDWYMAQFDGNRQITLLAIHNKHYEKFYFQDGPNPPEAMEIGVTGKYMDAHSKLHYLTGLLTVSEWTKAERTPNPALYPATHAWFPYRWDFSFDSVLPEELRKFSMKPIVEGGQINFFANTSQYNEGAVFVVDPTGKDIGRGFAEAVQFANTVSNSYELAGISNPADRALLDINYDNLFGRLSSALYVLMHKRELKKVMSQTRGLKYFSNPRANKK